MRTRVTLAVRLVTRVTRVTLVANPHFRILHKLHITSVAGLDQLANLYSVILR